MHRAIALIFIATLGCSSASSPASVASTNDASTSDALTTNASEIEVSETVVIEGSKFSGYELRVWLSANAPADLATLDRVEVTSASYSGVGDAKANSTKPSCSLDLQKTVPSSGGGKGGSALPYLSFLLTTAFGDAKSAALVVGSECGIDISPPLGSNNKEPKVIRIFGTRAGGTRFTAHVSTQS